MGHVMSLKPPDFPNSFPKGMYIIIGSTGLVYSPTFGICLIFMVNVGKYTSPMDPMGLEPSRGGDPHTNDFPPKEWV